MSYIKLMFGTVQFGMEVVFDLHIFLHKFAI